jgi:hypothetical protein
MCASAASFVRARSRDSDAQHWVCMLDEPTMKSAMVACAAAHSPQAGRVRRSRENPDSTVVDFQCCKQRLSGIYLSRIFQGAPAPPCFCQMSPVRNHTLPNPVCTKLLHQALRPGRPLPALVVLAHLCLCQAIAAGARGHAPAPALPCVWGSLKPSSAPCTQRMEHVTALCTPKPAHAPAHVAASASVQRHRVRAQRRNKAPFARALALLHRALASRSARKEALSA